MFYLQINWEIVIGPGDICHTIILDLILHIEFTLQIIILRYSWIDSTQVRVNSKKPKAFEEVS